MDFTDSDIPEYLAAIKKIEDYFDPILKSMDPTDVIYPWTLRNLVLTYEKTHKESSSKLEQRHLFYAVQHLQKKCVLEKTSTGSFIIKTLDYPVR